MLRPLSDPGRFKPSAVCSGFDWHGLTRITTVTCMRLKEAARGAVGPDSGIIVAGGKGGQAEDAHEVVSPPIDVPSSPRPTRATPRG